MKRHQRSLWIGAVGFGLLNTPVAQGQVQEGDATQGFFQTWGVEVKEEARLEGTAVTVDSRGYVYWAASLFIATGAAGPRSFDALRAVTVSFDERGMVRWARGWGGSKYDRANAVAVDARGDIYVTGSTTSFGAGEDVFLLKYDESGNLLWSTTWGQRGVDRAHAVVVDRRGNVCVTGETAQDVLVLKYSAAGELLWSRSWGGPKSESGRGIATDADGNVVVTGYTESSPMGLLPGEEIPAPLDVILVKFSKDGQLLWGRTWGERRRDEGEAVAVAADGSIYVAGTMPAYDLLGDGGVVLYADRLVLLKYDGGGNLRWSSRWYENEREHVVGQRVISTGPVGGPYVSAGFTLLRFAEDGRVLWSRRWHVEGSPGTVIPVGTSADVLLGGYLWHGATGGTWYRAKGVGQNVRARTTSPGWTARVPSGTSSSPQGINVEFVNRVPRPQEGDVPYLSLIPRGAADTLPQEQR